jgi:hypothetical protein
MLDPRLYGEAFTLAVDNYSASHARGDEARAIRALKTMGKLIEYMGKRGYLIRLDESRVSRHFVFLHRGF